MDPDLCLVTTLDLLDAESQSLFVLTLTAIDGGSPALTGTMSLTVHVTAQNDHTPVFSPSTVHVQLARAVPPNTVVYTALATDDDTGNNGEVSLSVTLQQEGGGGGGGEGGWRGV